MKKDSAPPFGRISSLRDIGRTVHKFIHDWREKRAIDQAISSDLAEALELLVVVLQAGLDLQVALQIYVEKGPPGLLRDRFERLLRDIQVGFSRVEALKRLSQGLPHPDMKETVRTILQSLELGSSLGEILQTQARELRLRRALAAERRAATIPLKLMFPLFFCIFPTILILLVGPVALQVFETGTMP